MTRIILYRIKHSRLLIVINSLALNNTFILQTVPALYDLPCKTVDSSSSSFFLVWRSILSDDLLGTAFLSLA